MPVCKNINVFAIPVYLYGNPHFPFFKTVPELEGNQILFRPICRNGNLSVDIICLHSVFTCGMRTARRS